MHRRFNISYSGRDLEIRIRSIEEAWELWLFEDGRRLALVAVLTIEQAINARRSGATDPIAEVVRSIAHRLNAGDILVTGHRDWSRVSGYDAAKVGLPSSMR